MASARQPVACGGNSTRRSLVPASPPARTGRLFSRHIFPRQSGTSTRHYLRHGYHHRRRRGPRERATPIDIGTGRVLRRVVARRVTPGGNHCALRDRRGCRARGCRKEDPLLPLGQLYHVARPVQGCPPMAQRACRSGERRPERRNEAAPSSGSGQGATTVSWGTSTTGAREPTESNRASTRTLSARVVAPGTTTAADTVTVAVSGRTPFTPRL